MQNQSSLKKSFMGRNKPLHNLFNHSKKLRMNIKLLQMNNTNCNQTINSWKKFMMHFKQNTILLLPKKTSTLLVSRHNLQHCKRNFKIIWRGMKKLLKKRMSFLIVQSKKKTTIYLKLSKKRTTIYLTQSKKRTTISLKQ